MENSKGRNIVLAFRYIQQIFRETSQVMKTLDSFMGQDWISTYGNRTTKEVTTHLEEPENWIVEASFRIYNSKTEKNIRKGITIAYWGENIDEPILIGGKLDYIVDEKSGNLKDSDHWDLWQAWFEENYDAKRADGTIFTVKPKESTLKNYIKEARLFAISLVSLQSEDDIKTMVYNKLVSL